MTGLRAERRSNETRIRAVCTTVASGGRLILRTPALDETDTRWFSQQGFQVVQILTMLHRDCRGARGSSPKSATLTMTRRQLRSRRRADLFDHLLRIDAESFPAPWNLDGAAFEKACNATDDHVVRVATDGASDVIGFALIGRTGSHAYLQRLAVAPRSRRKGVGRRLVEESLAWASDRGADMLFVNTEPTNSAALALYASLRFTTRTEVLSVLEREIAVQA